jgi:hypothetical protein
VSTNLEVISEDIYQEISASQVALLSSLLKHLLAKGFTGKNLNAEVKKRGYKFEELRLALKQLNPAKLDEIDQELHLANEPPLHPDEVKRKDEDIKVQANNTTSLANTAPQITHVVNQGLQTAPTSSTAIPTSGDKVLQSPPQFPDANSMGSSLVAQATKILSIFNWKYYGSDPTQTAQNSALDPKPPLDSPLQVSQETSPFNSPRFNPNEQSGSVMPQFHPLLDTYARSASTGASNSSSGTTPGVDDDWTFISTDGKEKSKNSI